MISMKKISAPLLMVLGIFVIIGGVLLVNNGIPTKVSVSKQLAMADTGYIVTPSAETIDYTMPYQIRWNIGGNINSFSISLFRSSQSGDRFVRQLGRVSGSSNFFSWIPSSTIVLTNLDDNKFKIGVNGFDAKGKIVGSAKSQLFAVARNSFSMTRDPLSSSEKILVKGSQITIGKFTITSRVSNLTFDNFTIRIVPKNVSVFRINVYAFTDSAYSIPDANFSSTLNPSGSLNSNGGVVLNGLTTINFPIKGGSDGYPLVVPSGENRYLKIVADISNIVPSGVTASLTTYAKGNTEILLDTVSK